MRLPPLLLLIFTPRFVLAGELPIPCGGAACGAGPSAWVTAGNASAALAGSALTVTQLTDSATLNWASFNIGTGNEVTFVQPDASATALNRIYQADPSRIFGALRANGRVFLLNQNGFLFGAGSTVDVGALLASSLELTPAAIERGIARAVEANQPALRAATGSSPGAISVEAGASISAAEGGQILLFAPDVTNAGRLDAPAGQVILGAGRDVYLVSSADPNLRGFLVQVNQGGTVTNAATADVGGSISASRGNVTLAGLTVNQGGRVSATTSVRENGSIRLAAEVGTIDFSGVAGVPFPTRNGTLTLGPASVTEVSPEIGSAETAVDATVQRRSTIELEGELVQIQAGARVSAPSGSVTAVARSDPRTSPDQFDLSSGDGRLIVEGGAVIDTAGLGIELPVERNLVAVELRGNQLRDSPIQRDGPLRGETVTVDIRDSGVRADGTAWQGTPLADASGEIATIQRGIGERSVTGGTVSLAAERGLFLLDGSLVDVSGGQVAYQPGVIDTTKLLGADGRIYDVAQADPDRVYTQVANGFVREHPRWGVAEVFAGFSGQSSGRFEPGYIEGYDAGQISILAPNAVLDGSLQARATAGPLQRFTDDADRGGPLYPFNEIPHGGALTLGSAAGRLVGGVPDYVLDDVVVESGSGLAPFGAGFDPRAGALPSDATALRLRPDLLTDAGFGSVSVYANGTFTLPPDVAIRLPVGGSLAVRAGIVDIAGEVTTPGGRVALEAAPTTLTSASQSGLELGAQANLAVAGLWTNDSELAGPAALGTIATSGGTIDLKANLAFLALQPGSRLDASGGAWRDLDGRIVGGDGGTIAIRANPANGADRSIVLGATLSAFGLEHGGTSVLEVPDLCVACSVPLAAGTLAVSPAWFTSGGFENVELRSTVASATIGSAARVEMRQRNWLLPSSAELAPSAGDLWNVASIGVLPDDLRRPVNLTLAGPSVVLDAGSVVAAEPGASIDFSAAFQIVVNGTIDARAGSVVLHLTSDLPTNEFLPEQGIWLGDAARIDLRGAFIATPNDLGLRTGKLLDSGRFVARADRGYVVTAPGSIVDVSGIATELDLVTSLGPTYRTTPTAVASSAGRIELTAAEGMLLNGSLIGRAAAVDGAAGGSLAMVLDPTNRNEPDVGTGNSIFPLSQRVIEITENRPLLVVGTGRAVPSELNGHVTLGASQLQAGGFDTIDLGVRSLFGVRGFQSFLASPGTIAFAGDVSLAARRELGLDAAALVVKGGSVDLAASVVSLGNSNRQVQPIVAPAYSADGELTVTASLIDLVGTSSVSGVRSTHFDSSGDVRLTGVQLGSGRSIEGALHVPGELSVAASQVYPTTLTNFELVAESAGLAPGSIAIHSPTPGGAVLSAGGGLTLRADTIEQDGTVRAPFGTLDFIGRSVTFGPSSVTSTSAQGSVIPFGAVQGGSDWVYELLDRQTLLVDSPPSQSLRVDAAEITFAAGSTVDVSGGGDMLAYEFVPGVGGSRDYLSPAVSSGLFAILPGLDVDFAPLDPHESSGVALRAGDAVLLDGIGGQGPQRYTLLPARYALLPGAYLVRPVAGYTDILPQERFAMLGGEIVVSGRRTVQGTDILDSRSSGFAISPGSNALRQAQYQLSTANSFFAGAGDTLRLPRDSGTLSLTAGTRLDLLGSLVADASADGRGARVDISGTHLRIADSADPGGTADEVLLSPERLTALGAESILLGGTRRSTADGIVLDVAAESVVFGRDTTVAAPEILAAATDEVRLDSGATVATQGIVVGQPDAIRVDGSGAFLRVSAGAQTEFRRTAPAASAGTLTLAPGASLISSGSTWLDASFSTTLDGNLRLGGALALGAPRITFSEGNDGSTGLTVPASLLDGLALDDLTLRSGSAIEFRTNVALAVAGTLRLDAQSLLANGSIVAELGAQDLALEGFTDAAAQPALAGGGRLTVTAAERLVFGAGTIGGSGWERSDFVSHGDIVASADGALSFGGDITLAAARVTADSGVDYRYATTGALTIRSAGETVPAHGGLEDPGLGASLRFTGGSIAVPDARIHLPSGLASFTALDGDIRFGATAQLNLAGVDTLFDGSRVPSPGGEAHFDARSGSVVLQSGAVLDVSGGPSGADAGAVQIAAPAGRVDVAAELRGHGGADATGAAFAADGSSIDGFAALLDALGSGGFTNELKFRQRGAGNLSIGAGRTVTAHTIELATDRGSVLIDGVIDATGKDAGRVALAASDGITVSGTIRATGGGGGDVELYSSGALRVGPAALIDVADEGGADAGRIRLRAPAASIDAPGAIELGGELHGSIARSLELFNVYEETDGVLGFDSVDPSSTNPLFADAAAIVARRDALRAQLGRDGDAEFAIVPGVEIRAHGGLTLDADWNLADWRFDGTAGVLTLRAADDLVFNRSLSDGFAAVAGGASLLDGAASWSYRLVAGAAFDGASPLALKTFDELDGVHGDLRIAPGVLGTFFTPADFRLIRTGTGTIDVAAARDIVLGNRASAIYTAGRATYGTSFGGLNDLPYPEDGGDLSLRAGRDILGGATNQMVTDWLWRVGRPEEFVNATPTAWTVNFAQFGQNAGALGGGDVRVEAGRDIVDFSAVVPTVGRRAADPSTLEVIGGGDLFVAAGNDIRGGSYYVGRGAAQLRAGGSVGAESNLAPLLGLATGTFDVTARRDVRIESVVNPTVLPQGTSQRAGFLNSSYFASYSPEAAVRLLAVGGDASLSNDTSPGSSLQSRLTSFDLTSESRLMLAVYPPSLWMTSLRGDVNVENSFTLFPAPAGNLDLLAYDTLRFQSPDSLQVLMSDADAALLPNIEHPDMSALLFGVAFAPAFHAAVPVHSGEAGGRTPDDTPIRLVAANGDVLFQSARADGSLLSFPKPVRVVAGRDIRDLSMLVQHLDLNDESLVLAGRDVVYSTPRTPIGTLSVNPRGIVVSGPGRLDVLAGRDINLQASDGIATDGNLLNSVLPEGGADIGIVAGLGGGGFSIDAFAATYLNESDTYASELVDYVARLTGATPTLADARERFDLMTMEEKLPLIEQVFLRELRASGRAAAQPETLADFSRGFAAIDALFPGANPNLDAGEVNRYNGALSLFFSRIYTLDGGDISLLVPGGDVNAGLATPPSAFGIPKQPSLLGIVAQREGDIQAFAYGDFSVNESRVFAADGGNIMIWSTRGDIDAGRGAKTAISAPPPTVTIDADGNVKAIFPPALAGSGIRTLATSKGMKPGDVDLFAPRGVVNAGDAGIVAGNLTIAATAVLGADNISVSGVAVGVPVDTGGFAAALTGVSAVASSASNAAQESALPARQAEASSTPLADQALGFLDVFVTGFGEQCDPTKENCEQRERERREQRQ